MACIAQVKGLGFAGYEKAILLLQGAAEQLTSAGDGAAERGGAAFFFADFWPNDEGCMK